jgi:sulfopyruvate decarboxylase TPP-binding subunit
VSGAHAIFEGLKAGGITFSVYLPDSVLYQTERLIDADPEITSIVCSREDEGVAIAVGASLAGERVAVLMEGSGMGLSGLILARAQSQRTPLLLIFSHVRSRGDRFDYHLSSRLAGEGTCLGLGIPYETAYSIDDLPDLVHEMIETAIGQRTIVALAVPGSMES